MKHRLTKGLIEEYGAFLRQEEKALRTIEKYLRDVNRFYRFLVEGRDEEEAVFGKEQVMEYKEALLRQYRISSINSMLVALNRFLDYAGWSECRVRQFKVQKAFFCREDRYLTKREYERLLEQARCQGDFQLSLIMQTICSTGIRVGELSFVDVKAVENGCTMICNKGKTRMVFLPKPLVKLLKEYCRKRKITDGAVFVSNCGKIMDRSVIWRKMKRLCQGAGVDEKKVFPHNLRHLFAFTFYRAKKDLLRLAEILGHTSIETTRIYTATTGREHVKLISRLGLVYSPQVMIT